MKISANLYLTKGDFTLDVDFSVPAKGVTAIFGPSGSGKTTLIRAIAGLDQSNGFLKVGDETWQDDKENKPTYKRALGYIFQESNLFPHLSVEKNLRFGLNRISKNEQSIGFNKMVDLLGISHLLERSTRYLSGGERQKVAIGRALLSSPKLLLMDEPLSSLDYNSKFEAITVLENVQRELGVPTFIVTHSKDEVMRLADQILLMNSGRVVASGSISEMLTRSDLSLSHEKDAGVIVEAQVIKHDKSFHITHLVFKGGDFQVPFRPSEIGEFLRLRVMARDVSLSLSLQTDSSLLNIFQARVEEIIVEDDSQATIKLDIGGITFLSRISRKSVSNLELRIGKIVFAQVKAAALID